MAAFSPERIPNGWRLDVTSGGETPQNIIFEVVSSHLDRGVVRAALTVRTDQALLLRDTVNLTSGRARARVVEQLAEKRVTVDERPLVALDDACRKGKAGQRQDRCDGSPDVSGTVPPLTLTELELRVRRWLLVTDHALIPVLVGAVLAHRLDGDPVWLLNVAPPGGTKSELLRALYGYPSVYPLSELTAKTFASGLEVPGGADPSLLNRLTNEILVLKDFTSVLTMRREDRQTILAQLREIYDGRYDKTWGTGRELHWEGRVGFVAGVTPIIDGHQAAMSVLGERFVLLRPVMPDRKQLAIAALKSRGREREMRQDLATAMHGFLAARGSTVPDASAAVLDRVATVADFITRARSGVQRDGYKRELEYAPEPEAPTRFAKVLLSLGSGIALAYDSPEVTDRELRLVLRVALDCLPLIRHRVIAALVDGAIMSDADGRLSTSEIAGTAQFSSTTVRRALEDLQALDVVVCHKTGTGKADEWELGERWRDVFCALAEDARRSYARTGNGACDGSPDGSGMVKETVSETSPHPSHLKDVDVEEGVV
jgi:hypothetical protein